MIEFILSFLVGCVAYILMIYLIRAEIQKALQEFLALAIKELNKQIVQAESRAGAGDE